jgi:hypothetical protein
VLVGDSAADELVVELEEGEIKFCESIVVEFEGVGVWENWKNGKYSVA